jgi:predicted O-linked N-acetylglucosamine transferase (SPINDLY family)/predicted SAM-dependent methyltransferase
LVSVTQEKLEESLATGDELRDAGDVDGALAAYSAVVAAAPGFARGHFKLATAYAQMSRIVDAEASYREALRLDPVYVEAHGNLGVLLASRGDWDEAERCYRNALANNPDYFESHLNLSRLLLMASRVLESLYFARRACALNPQSVSAIERTGQALGKLGRISESLAEFRRATEVNPDIASPWIFLANALHALGRDADADAAYVRAISIATDDPIPLTNRAFWTNYGLLSREQVWQRHREFGCWARRKLGPVAAGLPATQRPNPMRRLRVGFVSPDLRRHSVGYFVRGALQHLDRNEFQLFAYFDHHGEDSVSITLKPMFHQWRDIYAKPDDAVLEQIRGDRIDILIDLCGLTAANRLMLFARRAASVQVTYLGYPNTTGLDTMDYRLTDGFADPEGDGDEFHSEKLWRLPAAFLCYSAPVDSPEVSAPPILENGFATFGSFNNRVKISDDCLRLWVSLLTELPTSRLVLKSIQGTEDAESRQGLLDRFLASGIDPARVEVHAQVSGLEDHLAMYSRIDIALDTFPYNGTTTTCEALWMGVPVIALKGDRHAARVGVSLLNNVGLPELVAVDTDEYLRIARDLAAAPDRLVAYRHGMRERMLGSGLMDSRRFGRDFGAALRAMWVRHCGRFEFELPVESDLGSVTTESLRLILGGGESRDGWTNVDVDANAAAGMSGGAYVPLPFPDESCAEILASEYLQRLRPHEILPALNDMYRVLIPGGTLYLSVPDFEMLSEMFVSADLSNEDKFQVMRAMFGKQDGSRDMNRIGLSFDFMVAYLADVGFSSVEHVEALGLFEQESEIRVGDRSVSLKLVVVK